MGGGAGGDMVSESGVGAEAPPQALGRTSHVGTSPSLKSPGHRGDLFQIMFYGDPSPFLKECQSGWEVSTYD